MAKHRDPLMRPRLDMCLAEGGLGGVWLGHYIHTRAHGSLDPHVHHRAMEICFLVKGRQTYHVGGQNHRMKGGDIFLTFPNEWHSTGGLPQEKGVLYWLTLMMPRGNRSVLGLTPRQTRALTRELLGLKARHFRGEWEMKTLLDEVTIAQHERGRSLRELYIANRIHEFLLRVIACAAVASPQESAGLQGVRQYIEENLEENLPVSSLAARAGLSASRFKARFKEETGVPPAEYLLRARIERAKTLLAKTPVTETAYALGFSSSQYFATVFKRFTGQRPSEFAAAGRAIPRRRNSG